jgi:hypothetical protein
LTPSDGSLNEMRRLLEALRRHDPLTLDEQTAERLLAGALPAVDAPPGYQAVASSLRALEQGSSAAELAGEPEAVAAIASVVASSPTPIATTRRSTVSTKLRTAKAAAAALVGGLSLTTGLAMANALPGAAQDVASAALAKVGVSTPNSDDHADDHPDTRGRSGDHEPNGAVSSQSPDTTKGSVISGIATGTDATGRDKGAEISATASDGQSQAGQHGTPPPPGPPVSTPNGGGTATADAASGGASSVGTDIADEASNGHSAAGSGNASPPTDPGAAAGDHGPQP